MAHLGGPPIPFGTVIAEWTPPAWPGVPGQVMGSPNISFPPCTFFPRLSREGRTPWWHARGRRGEKTSPNTRPPNPRIQSQTSGFQARAAALSRGRSTGRTRARQPRTVPAVPASPATCSAGPGSRAASGARAGAARAAVGKPARCTPGATPRSCSRTRAAAAPLGHRALP